MKTVLLLIGFVLASIDFAEAQQPKVYRIGIITSGGAWYETIDGLRVGLKALGLEEGKQINLVVRDTKGDAKATEDAARNFEKEKVDLIYTTATSVTIAAKRATADIPIVFCAGSDPVVLKLVESFAHPGGRLTGVYNPVTDLTAKRLEILKEIVPKLRRVVTFYDPGNPVASHSAKLGREAARALEIELIERHFGSVRELQAGIRALKVGEVDAYFAVSDAVASNQAELIIETARVNRLATIFDFLTAVIKGGLASYSVNYYEVGRLSAKYVRRILDGVNPKDLAIEGVDKIDFILNLKTAKQIGLTIPPSVLARADRVIK